MRKCYINRNGILCTAIYYYGSPCAPSVINGVDINLNSALKVNAEMWELYGFTTIKNTYKK